MSGENKEARAMDSPKTREDRRLVSLGQGHFKFKVAELLILPEVWGSSQKGKQVALLFQLK